MVTYDFREIGQAEYAGVVTSAHFGSIFSTFYGLAAFAEQADLLGSRDIRWPGGTRGEMALDGQDADGDENVSEYLYDLNHDDLMTISGKGLSDALLAANASGGSLSLFLPSIRYFDDVVTAEADAQAFVEKLLSGGFGELPSSLVIELGNESLDGTASTAARYGAVVDAQLSGISAAFEALGGTVDDFHLKLAVQIGRSAEEDTAIRDQIDYDNIAMIDALIVHHLPINIFNHNRQLDGTGIDAGDNRFSRSLDYIESWSRAVGEARKSASGLLDVIASAWTVGPSSDVAEDAILYQDIGARQARTTIDTLANLLAVGVDAASLWGIDARTNPNWFTRETGADVELSHGGFAFQMMSESLEGMVLMDTYRQNWAFNGDTEAPISVYSFEDSQKYVIFVVAGDIELPETAHLAFEGLDLSRAIELDRLTTVVDEAGSAFEGTDFARLYETPNRASSSFDIFEQEFDFTVTEDYEVNRLTIWKDGSSEAPVWKPLDAANALVNDGSLVRETVQAADSEWALRGTEASEKLFDNEGDDLIEGGGGSDHFVFRTNGGRNIVFDFEQSGDAKTFDRLVLRGFGYDTREEAEDHFQMTDAGVLFVDQGTSILLDGFFGDPIDVLL